MRKQEYMIVTEGNDIDNMVAQINKHLLQGWECQGGIAVSETGIVQAMVRDLPIEYVKPNA
jgi:hypothetical protein